MVPTFLYFEGERVDVGLASLSRFVPEEEIDEFAEITDHSVIEP